MKINLKKIIASTLLSSVVFTTACSTVPEEVPVLMSFKNTDYQSVITLIDSISEASFETESQIEAAYAAYCSLEGSAKESVSNAEKLLTLREEVADLYEYTNRKGDRIDRSKILVGTYCFSFWDEAHVKELADCGIDFIAAAGYSEGLMDLLAKYGVGAFVNVGALGYPSWRGGDRDMGSEFKTPAFDVNYFESFAEAAKAKDHEAIWGIELVDEPYTDDFWFYNDLTQNIFKNHENYEVYINLFPNYASPYQLGSWTYQEHVDEYVKQVDIDYISYDHYMYSSEGVGNTRQYAGFDKAIENMRIVANACRDSDKDFWIVVQANHPDAKFFTSTDQLRMQANTALAFGATVINWACWNPGWYNNNICDSAGNKTEQYDKVKLVNEELSTLSPVFMKYKYVEANILGGKQYKCPSFYKNDDNVIDQDVFSSIKMSDETSCSILCGYFEKRQGEGDALMLVNITDPLCEEKLASFVMFKVVDSEAIVTEHTAHGSYVLRPDADGYYKVSVANAEYSFVTVE